MSTNCLVGVLALSFFFVGNGISQIKEDSRQVVLQARFITVSPESLKELGVAIDEVSSGPFSQSGGLDAIRDDLTDRALSPVLSGQVGLIVKGGNEGSSSDKDKPGLQLAGIDKEGKIRIKPGIDEEISVWQSRFPSTETSRSPEALSRGEQKQISVGRALAVDPTPILADEPLRDLDAAIAGTIHDVIANLEKQLELQKALHGSYVEITKEARENPNDENKEAAANARKSIQTSIYQKAVFEAALNYAKELSRMMESEGDGTAPPDVSVLPEDHVLRKRIEVHQRAIDSLQSWERKRRG